MAVDKGKSIVSGNIFTTFFKFTIPNVLSLMAMSSAAIVDGMFVGRFVGENALAAVNIVMPIYSIVFGIAIMLTIGGAVRAGKYLGENNRSDASKIFTNIVLIISITALIITILCLIFTDVTVTLLGANESLRPLSAQYLKILCIFFLFMAMQYSISVFIRVDGRPIIASVALVLGAIINAILDFIFIKYLSLGLTGAALATGISAIIPFVILITHFFSNKNKLRFTKPFGNFKEIFSAAYNGSSEFLSEMSAGILVFMFNRIMIENLGAEGVAAFTAINYALWAGGMLAYGVGDSIVPLVSVNYGARKAKRIKKFMALAFATVFSIGLIIFGSMTIIPDVMISIFLPDKTSYAFQVALEFTSYIRWAFFFIGLNIIFSSYFTAMHRPLESLIIASSRGLILPIIFLNTIPLFFGMKGVYFTVPLSEIITLIVTIFLYKFNSPSKRIERNAIL